MQENAKKYCSLDVIHFLKSICKEKKTMPKNSKCLEESLPASKVVKNLKKMKNSAFVWWEQLNKSRTLLSSSADNILLDPYNYSHYIQTRSILVNDDLW